MLHLGEVRTLAVGLLLRRRMTLGADGRDSFLSEVVARSPDINRGNRASTWAWWTGNSKFRASLMWSP